MNSIKKNLFYNFLYQFLIVILPLITAPYISRTLGAESLGIYSYIHSIAYYFLLFAMLGIGNHGNRSIAAVSGDSDKVSSVFLSIYIIQFITFLLAILLYILFILIFNPDNTIIYIIEILYLLSGLFDISWLYFGLEKFKFTVTKNIVIKLLSVLFIFIFVKNPSDLWKYTLIMSLGFLLSQFYLWFPIKKYISFIIPRFDDIKNNIKPIITLFVPVFAYSIYKVMDKIMIGSFSTFSEVGFYNNAEKIVNIPICFLTAFGTVMLPRMTSIISSGNVKMSKSYFNISMKFIIIFSTALCFGLIGISNVFAPVFFGTEFTSCGMIINLLSITIIFISIANVIRTQYLIPNHLDKIYVISTIVGSVINLTLNLLLIPKYSSVGASIGTIFAELSVMVVQIIYVRKYNDSLQIIVNYIPVFIIGAIMSSVVFFMGNLIKNGIYSLIVQIAVGALLYFIMIILFLYCKKDDIYFILYSYFFKKRIDKNE